MKAPRFLLLAVLLATALALASGAARAQSPDDPLRHGHALLIGNAHYLDRRWPPLDDVPLELQELSKGLAKHFDTVEVATNLDSDKLKQTLANFLGKYGSDRNARLMIYYAGHGYTELIAERNENRGYITGIDTPWVDGATESLFDAARPKAVSMLAVRAPLEEVRAKSILFIFDSCFSGTIFADRGAPATTPLTKEQVDKLLGAQARDIITAGTSTETVPAHSPIPDLLLAAIDGGADKYGWGVVSSAEIRSFMLDRARSYNLTPQEGPLRDSAFAGGSFLFRVIVPGVTATPENETIRRYRQDAANGDSNARVQLGYLYERGLSGLSKDEREAARLYKLAADQGNAWGQNDLGVFYRDARGGLPKDEREAARLFRLAADQGMTDAEVGLGALYQEGRGGLPEDDREAARLYKAAADQGNAWGQNNLGMFYRDGRGGLPKDEREAVRLFNLAAGQGLAAAQASLGYCYEMGLGGLPKNAREAARLYKLAADQGDSYAQAALKRLGH
jgi:TPR repeat protein